MTTPYETIVLARAGRPPLRFAGRRLARHARGETALELWRRRDGRWSVALTGRVRDAAVCADLAAASAWVEALCTPVRTSRPKKGARAREALALIEHRLADALHRRTLCDLAGRALADWQLLEPEPT